MGPNHHCPNLLHITFDGIDISSTCEHKHLGIILSSNLKWASHIEQVVTSSSKKLGLLRRHRNKLSFQQKCTVYLCVIIPAIEYGSVLYDNCTLSDALKLEHLQRRAALICTGAKFRSENGKLMELIRWDSLGKRRKIAQLCMFYQMFYKVSPPYLADLVQRAPSGAHCTRSSDLSSFNVIRSRTKLSSSQSSFLPKTSREWNKLPIEIKQLDSVSKFKLAVKKHFSCYTDNAIHCSYLSNNNSYTSNCLTQISLGLSPLRGQMFHYNLSDNPFCPKCFDSIETAEHFFLRCLSYTQARYILLKEIRGYLGSFLQIFKCC